MRNQRCNGLCSIVCALWAVACDDPASIDPMADLVGTWERLDEEDGTLVDSFRFEADGSFAFDEVPTDPGDEEEHLRGSFTVAEGVIRAAGEDFEWTMTYATADDRFAPAAGLKTAGDESVAGHYHTELFLRRGDESFGAVTETDLRPDGTGEERITFADGTTETRVGVWAWDEEEGEYELSYLVSDGFSITISFEYVGDAIGTFAWRRSEAP